MHTLGYPWKHFDEQIIYKETILPIPASFSQIFDFISNFGLNHYFEASNPFYTTISNLRSDPSNVLIMLFILWLFQKNVFLYHFLSLILHILNSCILFLTLNTVYCKNHPENSNKYKFITISILTLIWALNPLNTEAVLFATNWTALLTGFFLVLVFYLMINKRGNFLVFFLFLIALFTCEYSITLPLTVFCYIYAQGVYFENLSIKNSIKISIQKIVPLIFAVIPFIIYFLVSETRGNLTSSTANSFQLFFERVFWLAPQIFFHFLKLILFPIHLTIDQSDLVNISNTLFNPYSIICFLIFFTMIIFSLISAFNLRKKYCFYFFITFVPFFISLLPFLHIISPIYNLASERYLYIPLFFLIVGLSQIIFQITNSSSKKRTSIFVFIFLVLVLLSSRSYLRMFDWKDSASLFNSALKEAKSDLIKGLRMQMLGGVLYSYYSDQPSKEAGRKFIIDGGLLLEDSLQKLEIEKIKYQSNLPKIMKLYGLDPKTIQAKTAYLISFTKLGLERNTQGAYNIMKPHMEDLSVIDTQILDLYVGILFSLSKIDEAEKLLQYSLGKKLSPTILLPLAEIYKNKYKDLSRTEIILKESFKYFPYDSGTLGSLKNFYLQTQNPYNYAYYSYLHGLRTHSKQSLEEALKVYKSLYNQKMSNKVLENLKALKN